MYFEKTEADRPAVGPMDDLLVSLLAEGWSHRRVATFCDISTKTIQRRLKDEAFSNKVAQRKRERLTEVASRIRRITDKAIGVLDDAMDHEDVKIRMRAASSALDYQERYNRRAVFEADIDNRLSMLETDLDDQGGVNEPDPIKDPTVRSLMQAIDAVGISTDEREGD